MKKDGGGTYRSIAEHLTRIHKTFNSTPNAGGENNNFMKLKENKSTFLLGFIFSSVEAS